MRVCILILFSVLHIKDEVLANRLPYRRRNVLSSDFLSRYEKFPETYFIVFRCFCFSCFLFSGKRNTISLLLNKTHLPAAVVILNNKPTPFKAGIVTSFAFMPLARVTCGNYATRVPNVLIYGFYKSF